MNSVLPDTLTGTFRGEYRYTVMQIVAGGNCWQQEDGEVIAVSLDNRQLSLVGSVVRHLLASRKVLASSTAANFAANESIIETDWPEDIPFVRFDSEVQEQMVGDLFARGLSEINTGESIIAAIDRHLQT